MTRAAATAKKVGIAIDWMAAFASYCDGDADVCFLSSPSAPGKGNASARSSPGFGRGEGPVSPRPVAAARRKGGSYLRGSTAAPPPNGIVWSVSKDVTKYASLLVAAGKPTFAVYLGYPVNATLTGVYHATFIEFDDLNWSDTYRTCSISVRIDVKFLVNPSGDRLHFILMDRTGAKIEAIVAGNDLVHRFDLTLHMGRKYIIHGVTIRPNFEEVECRFINHTYECSFSARTFVESLSLEFPRYPKHLMSIHEVMRCPNKTFVDIVGIVVQYDDHQLIGRHPSAELYREVTFMDIWGKRIVVGISGGNLIQNSYRWSTTEGNKSIVLATMLRKNRKYGNLETSSYTTLAFNPDHPSARALDDIRQKIIGG
ncbi:Peptide-N4-(N-acetyl-beta-glucosaminyl)asparagine amidase A [Hordeum vulgare]|nr:Peptide-N4-(N-acetyl-beta-glucosaminyl)asparagine amidase A [Hordeum vulgare]